MPRLRVKIRHRAIDVEEDCLDYFFRFAGSRTNADATSKTRRLVTIKEYREPVLAAFRNLLDELLIRELREVFRGKECPRRDVDVHRDTTNQC